MRMQVRSLASLSGLRIRCCRELWCRWQTQLGSGVGWAAMAPIRPLAWEHPCAASVALKRQKDKKKKKGFWKAEICAGRPWWKELLSVDGSDKDVEWLNFLILKAVNNKISGTGLCIVLQPPLERSPQCESLWLCRRIWMVSLSREGEWHLDDHLCRRKPRLTWGDRLVLTCELP